MRQVRQLTRPSLAGRCRRASLAFRLGINRVRVPPLATNTAPELPVLLPPRLT